MLDSWQEKCGGEISVVWQKLLGSDHPSGSLAGMVRFK